MGAGWTQTGTDMPVTGILGHFGVLFNRRYRNRNDDTLPPVAKFYRTAEGGRAAYDFITLHGDGLG